MTRATLIRLIAAMLVLTAIQSLILVPIDWHGDAASEEAPKVDTLLDVMIVLSAFVFSIGLAGVLTRRNPLVVLLCLELMLNAGNLALIGFANMWGNHEGQVFALIVMVVAACEVVIGLGLIVAMYRNRIPIDVDEVRELRG